MGLCKIRRRDHPERARALRGPQLCRRKRSRLYVRELRLGKICENPSAQILRERREGRLGSDVSPRRPRLLRQTSSSRGGALGMDLEEQGRLTHPMRWGPATDKYVPVSWAAAFEDIGRELCPSIRTGSISIRLAVHRLKPAICISCSRACTAATICPIARTCATKAPWWRCPKTSALRSAPPFCRIFKIPTASSTSLRMSEPRRRARSTICRTPSIAASRSSPSICCRKGARTLRQSAIAIADPHRQGNQDLVPDGVF